LETFAEEVYCVLESMQVGKCVAPDLKIVEMENFDWSCSFF
jgi:hypothetical protein